MNNDLVLGLSIGTLALLLSLVAIGIAGSGESGSSFLSLLLDVDVSNANSTQILSYNGSMWKPTNNIGEKGDNGFNGTNGIDGINGTNGLNGLDFNYTGNVFLFNGTNGEDGTNGQDGTNGEDGQDGTNGTNGLNGMAGYTILSMINTVEVTKTNIGTSYVVIYSGLNGKEQQFNFTGYTQQRLIVWVNKVGTGTQDWKLSSDGTNSTIGVTDSASAGEHRLDSGWLSLTITGEYWLRVMGKSTVSGDDPVFRGFELLVK